MPALIVADGRSFTTAFFGELCLDDLKLTYINAGHNSPMLRQATGQIETLSAGGLPLGIPIGANQAQYEVGSTSLSPGDVLVAFTDGLVEAFNAREEEYGVCPIARPASNNSPGFRQPRSCKR